jgi:hypothetical protein
MGQNITEVNFMKKEKKKQKVMNTIERVISATTPSLTDPGGSYTGLPIDDEVPVQDSDDL